MDNDEKQFLANEILKNPLFKIITDKMEKDAIDRGVNADATDSLTHQSAMADVRAVRNFRWECERILRSVPTPKSAPA